MRSIRTMLAEARVRVNSYSSAYTPSTHMNTDAFVCAYRVDLESDCTYLRNLRHMVRLPTCNLNTKDIFTLMAPEQRPFRCLSLNKVMRKCHLQANCEGLAVYKRKIVKDGSLKYFMNRLFFIYK